MIWKLPGTACQRKSAGFSLIHAIRSIRELDFGGRHLLEISGNAGVGTVTHSDLCRRSVRGCSASCSPQRHDLRFWRYTFWVRLFGSHHEPAALNSDTYNMMHSFEMNLTFAKFVFDCIGSAYCIHLYPIVIYCANVQAHLFVCPRWCWLEPGGPLRILCSRGLQAWS